MRRTLIALSLLAPLALPLVAGAAPKKKKETAPAAAAVTISLEADLGKLKWGMSLDEVKTAYYEKLDAAYAEKIKDIRDTIKVDELLSQKKKEKSEFDASFKRFDTQSDIGRYASSIIGTEIQAGVAESIIIIKDEKSQRFLFFSDSKLYKMVVAYDSKYLGESSFEEFVSKIAVKHSEPAKRYSRDGKDGAKVQVAATWSDSTALLWAEDRRDFYGSVVLIYNDPKGRQLDRAKLLSVSKGAASKYAAPDSMIDSLGERSTPPPAPAETKETKKEPAKKETSKKAPAKGSDPLEGLGL